MKKFFLTLISISLLCTAVFAEDIAPNAATTAELSAHTRFLLKDPKKNKEKIQKNALELPYQERLFLYNKEKKEPFGPVAINVFSFLVGIPPNLGIGSFSQKDIAGGVIHLGTGLIGTGCAVGGCLSLLISKKTGRVCHTFTCSRRRYFARFMDIRHRPSYNLRFQIQ